VTRRPLGPGERGARGLRLEPSQRDARDDELVGRPQRGRERRGIEPGKRALGLVEAPEQQEAPQREISRMPGVDPVAVRFERRSRRLELLGRPAQVARGQRDFALGDDAPCAGDGFLCSEGPCRPSHERLRSTEVAELRHRNAAKRERRRIVAQSHPVQCAEGITGGECVRRGRDQDVHRNRATVVTLTVSNPALRWFRD